MRVCAGLWGLVLLSLQLLAARHASCAFLQNQLPLQVVLATPSELLDNATKELQVTESQAFQVWWLLAVGDSLQAEG